MKLADIIELAKAGYSYKQVKELLEYVETSPAVQEAAPDITPDVVPVDTPAAEPEPVKVEAKEEIKETENTSTLDKLFD